MSEWPAGAPDAGGAVDVQNSDGTPLASPAYALRIGAGLTATLDPTTRVVTVEGGGGGGIVESVVAGANVTVDDTDPANPIVSASGGGGTAFPNDAPASPTAFDDEFEAAAIDVKWTQVAVGGAGFTTDPDKYGTFLSFTGPGAGSGNQLLLRQALTGFGAGVPLTVTMRASLSGPRAGTIRTGFALGSSVNYLIGFYVGVEVGTTTLECFADSGTLASPTRAIPVQTVYLHFQRSATNVISLWASDDGIGWERLYSGSKSFDCNYLFLRLLCHNAPGTPSGHLIDWVRVNDPRFAQPEA